MRFSTIFSVAATASTALGASLQQVFNWGANPTNIQFHIYVPDRRATNPAIIVAVSIALLAMPWPVISIRGHPSKILTRYSLSSTLAAATPSSGSAGPVSPSMLTSTASS
jgi:hypothetical protein